MGRNDDEGYVRTCSGRGSAFGDMRLAAIRALLVSIACQCIQECVITAGFQYIFIEWGASLRAVDGYRSVEIVRGPSVDPLSNTTVAGLDAIGAYVFTANYRTAQYRAALK